MGAEIAIVCLAFCTLSPVGALGPVPAEASVADIPCAVLERPLLAVHADVAFPRPVGKHNQSLQPFINDDQGPIRIICDYFGIDILPCLFNFFHDKRLIQIFKIAR